MEGELGEDRDTHEVLKCLLSHSYWWHKPKIVPIVEPCTAHGPGDRNLRLPEGRWVSRGSGRDAQVLLQPGMQHLT